MWVIIWVNTPSRLQYHATGFCFISHQWLYQQVSCNTHHLLASVCDRQHTNLNGSEWVYHLCLFLPILFLYFTSAFGLLQGSQPNRNEWSAMWQKYMPQHTQCNETIFITWGWCLREEVHTHTIPHLSLSSLILRTRSALSLLSLASSVRCTCMSALTRSNISS